MDQRERFIRTMQFEKVDGVPNYELPAWGKTVERWRREGLPAGVNWTELFGAGNILHMADLPNVNMLPLFEEEIIEETDRYVVYINRDGIKSRDLKGQVGHVMPQWLEYPVKNRQDFRKLKQRYDAEAPERYPDPEWGQRVEAWKERDYQLRPSGEYGAYYTLRQWMGTENLSLAFYDQPLLIHEMIEFLTDFLIKVLQKAVEEVDFDHFYFMEDMAYKGAPLVSPKQFREFLLPFYKRVTEFLRSHGIKILMVDSDGNFDVLIPLLIEGGVTGTWPLEQASGPEMNPVALRKKYGNDLTLMGGIDKRTLAKDKKSIEAELMGKLPYLFASGGYIPFVDHTMPHDIPFDNFKYYMELKRKLLEG